MLANALVYSSILLLIAAVASLGYHPDQATDQANAAASQANPDLAKPSVNQLAVAGLAAKTAEVAGLAVANDVSNASITLNAKSELAQQDETVITKPQVFQPTTSNAIITYKTVVGDTVPSVAAHYGITPQTLRWANNLTTDVLVPGVDILVPGVDGVVYVTKDGDTLDAIAAKYQSDKERIISKNDLELATGLTTGQRIVLPNGILPANERPGYVAPRRTTVTSYAVVRSNPMYTVQAGNRYAYGNCTWYAYNRRMQIGRPVGSLWGNAASWAYAAASAGYKVTHGNPGVGDVMQNGGGLGHVAVVENVYADGSIRISEMNWFGESEEGRNGWNIVSHRSLDAGAVLSYNFIK